MTVRTPGGSPRVFVGRQAIFDRRNQVLGYELLYRTSEENRAHIVDETMATLSLMRSALLDIGLDGLIGTNLAFVNVSKSFLANDLHQAMPCARVVLEVHDDHSSGDLAVLIAMAQRDGYRVAVDDRTLTDALQGQLDFIDYVKIDISKRSIADVLDLARALRSRGVALIAEKVETSAQYARCVEVFPYVQGYFFQVPVIVDRAELATDRVATLLLLAEYSRPEATLEDFEAAVSRDPALTYRVLQLANSGYASLPKRVDSLRQALVFLGIRQVRNLALIASLNRVEDKPVELISSALVRAKTCEQLAAAAGTNTSSAFTTGLLSLVDALTGIGMEEAMATLNLTDEVRDAIVHRAGPLGRALHAAVACERASVQELHESEVEIGAAADAFRSAVGWANTLMRVG